MKQISKLKLLVVLIAFGCLLTSSAIAQVGTWTAVGTPAPDENNGVMLLMTDGSVICHTTSGAEAGKNALGDGTIWDKLTPDINGSYINGTWTTIAPMIEERFSFSSAVLRSGNIYAAGGEYGNDGTQAGYHGESYNPLTNAWTAITGSTSANVISDGNCILLDNSDVLQGLVDVSFPVHNVFFNPTTNAYTAAPSTSLNAAQSAVDSFGTNESMWLKLPDNSILFVDEDLQTSERYIPALNKWIRDSNVPVALYDPYGYECGPGLMLPNGKAFFIGGTGHTAYYTPSGSTAEGTWTAGPDVPGGYAMPDAPGAMLPNGKILFACSPIPTQNNEFSTPTKFYEFNYLTNTYAAVAAPSTAATNAICQNYNFLDLPDGTVLCGLAQGNGTTSKQYFIYKPVGAAVIDSQPVISQVIPITCTTYMLTGKRFNGFSAGSAFGDENESDSNYPLARFTSNGKVYYARSYNWNSTGIQRGNRPDTVYITLPANLPASSYLTVVANGIPSDSLLFSNQVASLSSPTSNSICSGSAFTYTPASTTNGATFSWTRAAVTGVSNAAVTTAQTANPNETLVNTTSLPVVVTYAYSVTGGGCSNTVNVLVSVNPKPVISFTAAPLSTCAIPDSVTFTNTTLAGTSYVWSFGDGGTSTIVNPAHTYLASGNFSIKLVASSACGTDSLTQANYVDVTAPAAPAATSPVTIGCSAAATLTATGTGTLSWFSQQTGGTALATGGTYVTPVLNSNTTYYVQSQVAAAVDSIAPYTDGFGTGGNYTNDNYRSEVFTVNQACTLVSVVVYSTGAGNRTITLLDTTGLITLQTATVNIPNGTSTVTLNWPLTTGAGYQLGCGDNATITNLYRNITGAAFPYTDPNGYVTITGNNVPDNVHYYFFYDWKLQGATCTSARTPVNVIAGGGLTATTASQTNINCNGGSNGAVTVSPTGGTPNYTYAWSTGQTTAALTGLSAGSYTITIHDAAGCVGTATEVITQPNALNVSITSTGSTCGLSNGSLNASVTGGTTAYGYLWSNASTSATASNLAASIYNLTVTDAHSCTASATGSITNTGSINLSTSTVSTTCNGNSNGGASVTVSGSTGSITYAWSNGTTTASISNVAAGNYSVTASVTGGCSATATASVPQPAVLNISLASTNSGCGSPNGSAQATVTGGTAAYTYTWSNAATTSSIANLAAATYVLTVTDSHHCTTTSSAVIANSNALNVAAIPASTNCSGASTGGASATVSGGTSPFTYTWSNGTTVASISGVTAGTYRVSVSDNSGCSGTASVVVVTGSVLNVSATSNNAHCFNANDGSASVTITAGTSPYTYYWNNGNTTSSISNLESGTYVVTVTDAHGCQSVDTSNVTQPSAITIFVTTIQPVCVGQNNGSASATATGGTPGYSYLWSDNSTGLGISSLTAGTYSISLTDNNNCSSSASFNIVDPVGVSSTVAVSNDPCFGESDGIAQITTTGGTGPYIYSWSNAAATATVTGLAAGSYQVTISDIHNCSTTLTANVSQPVPIVASGTSTDATGGNADGSATVNQINGGTPPYTINWSNGESGDTATGLVAGQYKATISDHNGCTNIVTITVNDTALGINTIASDLKFAMYPNPANTEVTIATDNLDKETTLLFEDMLGQTLVTRSINTSTSKLDLSSFADGVYFVELVQDGKRAVKKLVISR